MTDIAELIENLIDAVREVDFCAENGSGHIKAKIELEKAKTLLSTYFAELNARIRVLENANKREGNQWRSPRS